MSSYACLVRDCRDISSLRRVHAFLQQRHLQHQRLVGNLLVHKYGECGHVEEAQHLFDTLPSRNEFTWNAMLVSLTRNGRLTEASSLLQRMPSWDLVSWNSTIAAYAQSGDLEQARAAMGMLPAPSVYACTAMITAYGQSGQPQVARRMFDNMCERNEAAWTALVAAYARNGAIDSAEDTFHKMPKRDTVAWNCMVRWYIGMGRAHQARRAFDSMPARNIISWATMIAGYAQNGKMRDAGLLFSKMPLYNLVACTAALAGGANSNSLLSSGDDDVVSWTAVVATKEHVDASFATFYLMLLQGRQPNEVTFLTLFCACSHAGLLERCRDEFLSMQADFAIAPRPGHYECLVDLLGRTGHLDYAEELIRTMPFEPNTLSWTTLLSACKMHADHERAGDVAGRIVDMEPAAPSPYCLLSSIYSTK